MTSREPTGRALAPGKLIISGEHAVVHGKPALAMAVNRYAETVIRAKETPGICFEVPEFKLRLEYSPDELLGFGDEKLAAYEDFLAGKSGIHEVLPRPVELIPFAFSLVLARTGESRGGARLGRRSLGEGGSHIGESESRRGSRSHIEESESRDGTRSHIGLQVTVSFSIPVGCGMGSSAAAGVSVLQAAAHCFQVKLSRTDLFDCSMKCERLIHGHPSGVDSYITLNGGAVSYQSGEVRPRPLPSWPFSLLNTGRPESTTGECVVKVREQFADSSIWDDFEAVTRQIDDILTSGVTEQLKNLIRQNHRLLCQIGVVPEEVQRLISAVEAQGGAAKICGAGAVRGHAAGVVLVLGELNLDGFCREFAAEKLECQAESQGSV